MNLILIVNFRSKFRLNIARAVAAGCVKHGAVAKIIDLRSIKQDISREGLSQIEGTDAVCCWGWRWGEKFRQLGHNVLIMERGFLADRFAWISLGWNGLNGRAKFPQCDDGGARWKQHFPQLLLPWRSDLTGYALLMGQVPSDRAVKMINFENWANATAIELRLRGHDVRFRPHPKAPRFQFPAPLVNGTLEQALSGASFAVTWNSNSGVDAVLSGTPAVTMDVGAMAWPVTSHDLVSPITMPDRNAWANRMAYTQWLPLEIERGDAWEHLRSLLPVT